MDQPGKKDANPARGQLNRENEYSLSPQYVPENLASRDGFSRSVPRQPAHLHTQAEGAYLRDSFRVPRRRRCVLRVHHIIKKKRLGNNHHNILNLVLIVLYRVISRSGMPSVWNKEV